MPRVPPGRSRATAAAARSMASANRGSAQWRSFCRSQRSPSASLRTSVPSRRTPRLGSPMDPLQMGSSGDGERAQAAQASAPSASALRWPRSDARSTAYRLPARGELDDLAREATIRPMNTRVDPGQAAFQTHQVSNMPPPLSSYNLFTGDRALGEGVAREGAGWALEALAALGEL